MNLQGKKVLVFGSGKSGIGAAELLAKVGAQPVIYDGNKDLDKETVIKKVPDCNNIEVYAGELPEETGSGSAESWCTDGYSACKELL